MQSPAEAYGRYQEDLVRFATSLVGPSQAQDVVSSAVLALLTRGALERADDSRALLYRAVLDESRSMYRSAVRRRRREEQSAGALLRCDPEIRVDVIAAVARLSPRQRASVFLTYWEDLTPTQIAQRLGVSEGSVRKHLARARARLREVLDA